MRITLDATPLLGRRTGIGRYAEHLLAELPAALERAGVQAEVTVTTWTARGGALRDLPPGVSQRGRRVPARLLRAVWRRLDVPPVELLSGRTDVFHGTNFVSPPTRGAREVVTVHDLAFLHHRGTVAPAEQVLAELVPRALSRGALVLCPSDAVRGQLLEAYRLPDERVRVTPLGVAPRWSAALPLPPATLAARGLPSDYVVFVGSLEPRKNLRRLVAAHALARTRAAVPDLVLVGAGGREPGPAGPGVHRAGYVPDDELRSLVAGARLVAMPSLDEGFGLPLLEAAACGRPVVASDLPVMHEVAAAGTTFADPSDEEALAHALVDALAAPDGPEERAARRAHAGRFTWSRTADATVAAYLAALP